MRLGSPMDRRFGNASRSSRHGWGQVLGTIRLPRCLVRQRGSHDPSPVTARASICGDARGKHAVNGCVRTRVVSRQGWRSGCLTWIRLAR